MHRLISWGPRIGFALLIAVLVGFELLFISEAREGAAALEAERTLREERAQEALDEALLGALDVAEARLEALETLPLVEEDGLLLVRDGVQLFPRLPGVAGAPGSTPKGDEEALRALTVVWPADERARQLALDAVRRADRVELPKGEWSPVFDEVLSRKSASPALRLALQVALLERAPLIPARTPLAGEGAQALVLAAWPWLSRKAAGQWCVQVQRLGDQLGLKTERFTAACQRGLSGVTVRVVAAKEPTLVGEWLMKQREGEVRGVHVDLKQQLEDLHQTLLKRRMLEEGEFLVANQRHRSPRAESREFRSANSDNSRRPSTPLGQNGDPVLLSANPLVGLSLTSPRLDAAHAALRAALGWKSALLALTALLGFGVVLLARLAEKRRAETLAMQREFISTVSHELRTPLAGIRLLAETLERKLGAAGPGKDYPHRLVVAADGLGFLVENILSFNRLESGRWVPRREPFPFASLESMLKDDATLAVDATVEVRCEGLAAMARHELDAQLVRVLVLNLLRNAWKYGRRQPVVFEVRGVDEGSVAVLRFSDNGPGVPSPERERVFEAFHRLPAAEGRVVGGSGLGLALARRIAGLHGGTLIISQSSDEGTTFELRLPRELT